MNRRLFKAYLFKEQFEHAWTYTTEQGMRAFLARWRRLLNWSRLTPPLIEFYAMLMRHADGVVAWARHRPTNAALEGNNTGSPGRFHGRKGGRRGLVELRLADRTARARPGLATSAGHPYGETIGRPRFLEHPTTEIRQPAAAHDARQVPDSGAVRCVLCKRGGELP